MTGDGRRRDGERIRREVLGDEHVSRSLARAGEFSRVMQDFVTEHCWGAIWSREGLGRRERSLINLGILTALNRSQELRVHVRGAIRNGCTPAEIQEVLLQTAIYCGVPAAIEAFRAAEAVLEEMEQDEASSLGAAVAGSGEETP
ncbi:MAG TPA: carboxymuconolactone decarboxylase family protein [Gaiellaceae bacterium]|nr:carboxymuconolactone decarboxylase family protein [Gaiellaceae bacterium]